MIEGLRPLSVIAAALNGDAGEVHRLIEAGTDIETRDEDDDTPLLAAAVRGHLEVVRYLLGRGANSSAINKRGRTAFSKAAQSGSLAVAETLLEIGSKINLPDKDGKTPLMYAAAKGGIDMIKFLIEHGAHIEAQDNEGYNALFFAVNFGQVVTTKYLLEHYGDKLLGGRINLDHLVGAAINAPSSNCAAEMAEECSILILRAIGRRAAQILVPTDDERDTYGIGIPLLTCLIASKKYSKKLIKAALDSGANPNGKFVFGGTNTSMLFAAVALDHPDAVEALIETGAVIDGEVQIILAAAVELGKHDACIAVLLRGGADVMTLSKELCQKLIHMVTDSEIVRKYLGVVVPPFALTTMLARHMNQLETLGALRFNDQRVIEYFDTQLPKLDGRIVQEHLSKLRGLLTEAPSAATKYAEEIRKIVVTAHVGSAKRIEDEKRGLRRAINDLARIVAREFDWYEDSEEARGFAEYLLASSDYKDAVRAGREAASNPTSASDIGISFEKRCQSVLTESGFAVATTTRSGDQGADLIGTKDGLTYVVQCKAWNGSVGNSAVQEAISARTFYTADFAAVVSDGNFTTSARELAARSHVVLIRADGLKMLDVICRAMA